MTPAPITISSSGTFFKDKAPVDDTIVSSSIWREGARGGETEKEIREKEREQEKPDSSTI